MADVVKTIAYRLQPDGGVEVASAFKAVETAGVQAGNAVASATEKASAAGERQTAQWKRMAEASRAAQQAQVSQETFGRALGINPTGNSARDSAAVFQESIDRTEMEARAVARLRAELEPLRAATDRYTIEAAELNAWHQKGLISTTELAKAQGRLKANYEANTIAIQRNTAGLTRNQMASRLNLSRQGADVLVTAAMGMNPAMIAIQQGPQILDALATSGIKARAALFLLGGALGVVATAAAVSAYAVWDAEQQNLALEKAVTGLGRTSGLTADQLDDLARAGAAQGDVSIKSARQQAAAYVTTGQIAGEIIPDLIALGKDYASVFGIEAEQATQDLAKAMAEPDKAARELTRTMGLFDQETLDTIDSLVKAGDLLAAQKLLLEGMEGALKGHADNVDEMTNSWQWLTRSIGDAITKFGEWLYVSDQEKAADRTRELDRQVAARDRRIAAVESGDYWAATGAGMSGLAAANPRARDQYANRLRIENERDRAEIARREAAAEAERATAAAAGEEAAANRDAQLAKDRQDRPRSNRSAGREAERAAREEEQRRRRAEDRERELQMIEAQAAADQHRIRALERQQDITARTRALIDDGMGENAASMKALSEQARIEAARVLTVDRMLEAREQGIQLQIMEMNGEVRFAEAQRTKIDLQARYVELTEKGVDAVTAANIAMSESVDLENARLAQRERAEADYQRDRAYDLAVLRGDGPEIDRRDIDRRIRERSQEIERRNRLNEGEGLARARREVMEELAAESEGAFKAGMADFIRDIRHSGLSAALARQFDRAADRFLEKLIDGLTDLDWARLMGTSGGGSGGGGLLAAAFSFFGGGSGGGSQGLFDSFRGFNAAPAMVSGPALTSKDVAQRTAAISGGKSAPSVTVTYAPVIHAEGAGPREVDVLSRRMDQMQEDLPRVIPGLVNEALSRGQVR